MNNLDLNNITIEMHVVNHCNLNCNSCNHFSPLAEPWFITLEDFISQIQLLKKKIPNIKEFIILGGEPTLHPQLFELCQNARKILSNKTLIKVISNGLQLKQLEKDLNKYKKLNIKFNFSMCFNESENIINTFIKNQIGNNLYDKILFRQTLVNNLGILDKNYNFFNCTNHKLPCLTLKNNKLYICPFCAHVEHYCKKVNYKIKEVEGIDYLNLEKMTSLDELQTFCCTPKNYCSYCRQDVDIIPINFFSNNLNNYNFSLIESYLREYDSYEKTLLQNKNYLNFNLNNFDPSYYPEKTKKEILRLGKGKIDIIIPYYNETIDQFIKLKENLLSQTIIEDCVIYLISDYSNMDLGVIKTFMDTNLNCVFLKNTNEKNPGNARNKGIDCSFNKIIYFLDADNSFTNDKALEIMYNEINNNNNTDIIYFPAYNPKKSKKVIMHTPLIKREALKNIRYKPFYYCEDVDFLINLKTKIPKNKQNYNYINNLNDYLISHNTTNKGLSITNTFYYYDSLFFAKLTSFFIGFYEISQENFNYNIDILYYLNEQIQFLHNQKIKNNLFIRSLICFELYQSNVLDNQTSLENKHYIIKNIEKEFNINIEEGNKIIIINYLYDFIKLNYINNTRLCNNAKYMLKILEQEKNKILCQI